MDLVEGVDYEMVPCPACKKPMPDFVPTACSDACIREISTCKTCRYNAECEYAWDEYNTNGDCLASK